MKTKEELARDYLAEQEASAKACCDRCNELWDQTGKFQAERAFLAGYDGAIKNAIETIDKTECPQGEKDTCARCTIQALLKMGALE